MIKKFRRISAIFFTILFIAMISAPSLIKSYDDSIDTSIFFGVNEEEEKEIFKLLFEITSLDLEDCFSDQNNSSYDGYTYKKYTKPHLNLISPPPEFIS